MKAARSHGSALELIVRNGGVDRQRDRRNLGRWAKPQVDTLNVTILGALLEELDQPASDPNRGLAGVVALPARQGCGVEQEQEVDVGRIIELVATKLAHRDDGEAHRFGVRYPLGDRGGNSLIDRAVGKVGKKRSYFLERQLSRKIAESHGKGQPKPSLTKLALNWSVRRGIECVFRRP